MTKIKIDSDISAVIGYFEEDIRQAMHKSSATAILRTKTTMVKESSDVLRSRYKLRASQSKAMFRGFGKRSGSLDNHFAGVDIRDRAIPLAAFLTKSKINQMKNATKKRKSKQRKKISFKILKNRTTRVGHLGLVRSKFKSDLNKTGYYLAYRKGNKWKEAFLQSPHMFYRKPSNVDKVFDAGRLTYNKRFAHEFKRRLAKISRESLTNNDKKLLSGFL